MPPSTSKPLTATTTILLLLLSLPLTHAIAQQSPLAPLPSTLSHLSALFTAPPPSTTTQPPCCGPACPPNACNIHLPAPSTDLAYLFPLPTTTAPAPSKITFPCCADACPDGACRASDALAGSERPGKPKPTAAPPPEGGRLRPGLVAPDDDDSGEASIIIGCCKKCKGCIQSAGPTGRGEVLFARATGTPSGGGGGDGDDDGDDDKKPKPPKPHPGAGGGDDGEGDGDGVRPPGRPGGKEPQICVGCVGGKCFPCISGARAPPVLFTPAGVGGAGQPAATAAAASVTAAAVAKKEEEEEPQPTILMAADVADAVKGVNQDVVPVVVQSFGGGADGETKGKGKDWELVTLLANVDLKVKDNYLSRKVVEALGLGKRVKGLKKGTGKVVVLDGRGKAVKVEGYVDVGIVIGSRSGIVIGSVTAEEEEQGEGGWRLLKGVRWFVHGGEDEDKLGSPDVVLGTKVLAEAGGLSLTEGVRREVQAGVKVLGIAHFINDAGTGDSKQGIKDEL